MKLRIVVHTPQGNARKTEELLRGFILFKRRPDKTGVNKANDMFYWEIENAPLRQATRIQRNIIVWDKLMRGILDSKLLRRYASAHMAPGELEQLNDMLRKKTRIEIIKTAQADAPTPDGRTWWEKLKEKISGHKPSSEPDTQQDNRREKKDE